MEQSPVLKGVPEHEQKEISSYLKIFDERWRAKILADLEEDFKEKEGDFVARYKILPLKENKWSEHVWNHILVRTTSLRSAIFELDEDEEVVGVWDVTEVEIRFDRDHQYVSLYISVDKA